ncbi:DUF6970 domain-containing protein [Hymenobacter cellulosivorans]|uniref:DUF6970 domain-containing protein n=1 Tax=Hymenobacter cellulosivorans TaxID=2932249 RepID=A0ABY4FBU1_9BACT|nr:hypothetical protein [Hymenobacter cellulosivorans]UOQ53414.1 hypothetical protein MUN80_01335 [Hymenobacter cellulosivorans]
MKSLLFLLSVWGCLGMVQCQKETVAPESQATTDTAASCVDARAQPLIDALLQSPKGNPAGEVWRYTWEGRTVFLVKPTHPDGYTKVYDLNDNQLRYVGAPSGGISGKGDGKCANFTAQATAGCQLWRDTR